MIIELQVLITNLLQENIITNLKQTRSQIHMFQIYDGESLLWLFIIFEIQLKAMHGITAMEMCQYDQG